MDLSRFALVVLKAIFRKRNYSWDVEKPQNLQG